MKAHISVPKTEPVVLCAGFSPERMAVLCAALTPCGAQVRCVPQEQLGCTVGSLAEGRPVFAQKSDASSLHADTECIVFCGLDPNTFDAALAALRGAKLSVPCKAVLTAVNRAWTFDALIGELLREHEAMRKRKEESAARS